jgi:hypothetical protein
MTWRRMLLVALVPATMAVFVPTAHAGQTVDWTGHTRQGLPIEFLLKQTSTGTVVHQWSFTFDLTCQVDGTHEGWIVGFFGFDLPVVHNRFSFSQIDPMSFFKMTGTFDSPIHATGVATWQVPGFTLDKQLQLCTPGTPNWKAHPSVSAGPTTQSAVHRITFTKVASGAIVVSRSG